MTLRTVVELLQLKNNRKTIAKEGGIKVILNAMKEHAKYVYVQEKGCAALRNLAVNDDNQKTMERMIQIQILPMQMK